MPGTLPVPLDPEADPGVFSEYGMACGAWSLKCLAPCWSIHSYSLPAAVCPQPKSRGKRIIDLRNCACMNGETLPSGQQAAMHLQHDAGEIETHRVALLHRARPHGAPAFSILSAGR